MLSFKELDKSRLFGIIVDQDGKFKENLFVNENRSKGFKQDEDFKNRISNYASTFNENEKGIIDSFELKEEFKIISTPPNFSDKENQRMVSYIVGRAGSGKSYYTSNLLKFYNHMYKKNKIYYVSANKITNDSSFDELLKKKDFQKVFSQIDLSTINSVIDFKNYNNCVFVFDDIIDVAVSLDPMKVAQEYIEDVVAVAKGKGKNLETKEYKLLLSDQVKLQRIIKAKSETIKNNILLSISALIKLGRKNGISLIITNHNLFGQHFASRIIEEAHTVVLFPYDNVSNQKLKDFLIEKLSLDNSQADSIIKTEFKKFDQLLINVQGKKFFFTSQEFKFI
jgi:hypothetical protein